MNVFDDQGLLKAEAFDEKAIDTLAKATEFLVNDDTRSQTCKPAHLLLALLDDLKEDEEYTEALQHGLAPSFAPEDLVAITFSFFKPDAEGNSDFNSTRNEFDPALLKILESCTRFAGPDGQTVWESDGPIGRAALWASYFSNPGPDDLECFKGVVNFGQVAQGCVSLLAGGPPKLEVPSLFSDDGILRLELFDDTCVTILETAREMAGLLGYDKIRPPHLLLGLLERPDGVTDKTIRLHAKPGTGPHDVAKILERNISRGVGVKRTELSLAEFNIDPRTTELLCEALELSLRNNMETVTEATLLRRVLEADKEGIAGRTLKGDELDINLDMVLRDLDKAIRSTKYGQGQEEITPYLIPGKGKCDDLTYLARTGQIDGSVGQDALIRKILQGLHKRQNDNILITGLPGVGKTLLVRELARRVAAGEIAFLKRKKIVSIDCDGLSPDRSRDRFNEIVAAVKGRTDVIVCLDHFDNIVRFAGAHESHNRAIIKVALKNQDIRLIGILEDRYYEELISSDFALLESFHRVAVDEVKVDQMQEILEQSAVPQLEKSYGLRIEARAARRAISASREFINSERFPLKAIKVLRDACELVSFESAVPEAEKTEVEDPGAENLVDDETEDGEVGPAPSNYIAGASSINLGHVEVLKTPILTVGGTANAEAPTDDVPVAEPAKKQPPADCPVVRDKHVVKVIAQRTGIDESTVAGTAGKSDDLRARLMKSVIGQEAAVDAVEYWLDRIKRGGTRDGKPAGVFLFAGLTGTGKTELAKAIAKIYSASGKMSVYPMTNFSESHSLSGLTGVPPGYVGYEAGGRLINDLNADPYKVVLFDEAEKAHKDVLQALLFLFDEAWIEDRRNVRAYGNRAIFILTTNAGADEVAAMMREDKPIEDIKDKVREKMVEFKNDKGERVFSPEFLGRFSEIIVFNPLDIEAMKGITQLQVTLMQNEWLSKREKKLLIDQDVVDHVAQLCHDENEKAGGKRGGRIAQLMVGKLVENAAFDLQKTREAEFDDADAIRISLHPPNTIVADVYSSVRLRPSEATAKAELALQAIDVVDVERVMNATAVPVAKCVERWSGHVSGSLTASEIAPLGEEADALSEKLRSKIHEFNETLRQGQVRLIEQLARVTPRSEDET